MSREARKARAAQFYAFLLKFYPQEHRQAFGSQMLQTFKDHYAATVEPGKETGTRFWFDVVSDEVRGVAREHFAVLKESTSMKNAWLKQGILFGIMLGIIHIGYNLINNLAPANLTLNNLLNTGIPLIVLIFTGVAGYVTALRTGETQTGTYAGLLTGLLSIVIGISALFAITFAFMDIIRQNAFMIYDFHHSGLQNIDQFIIEDAIGGTFVGTLFSLLAGGLFGTLGGYIGSIAKKS